MKSSSQLFPTFPHCQEFSDEIEEGDFANSSENTKVMNNKPGLRFVNFDCT